MSLYDVDIIDGNLKLILGMIWTLILRFTIADIRYDSLAYLPSIILIIYQAQKVFPLKKACSCGVNGRQNPTKKLMFKIFRSVGRMGLLCSCIGVSEPYPDTYTALLDVHSSTATDPIYLIMTSWTR